MTRDEESLDQALLQDILDSLERRAKTAETPKNPEIHFGLDIAERLNCLNPRQKAVAKLRIQRVMLEVEFPEQTTSPHMHLKQVILSTNDSLFSNEDMLIISMNFNC